MEYKSLTEIHSKTRTFQSWIKYLNSIFIEYNGSKTMLQDIEDYYFKGLYEDAANMFSCLMNELKSVTKEDYQKYPLNPLIELDGIIRNIKRYHNEFTPEKIQSIFKVSKLDYSEKNFKIFKEIDKMAFIFWDKKIQSWAWELCVVIDRHYEKITTKGFLSKFRNSDFEETIKKFIATVHYDDDYIEEKKVNVKPNDTKKEMKLKCNVKLIGSKTTFKDKLDDLFDKLIRHKFIADNKIKKQFIEIFSGKNIEIYSSKINWEKSQASLSYFITKISILYPDSEYQKWVLFQNIFNVKGKPITNKDYLKAAIKDAAIIDKKEIDEIFNKVQFN